MKLLHFLQNYTHYLIWILGAFVAAMVLYWLLGKIRYLLIWWQSRKREAVLLQLTPPANHESSTEADEQLMNALYGLDASRTWKDKLLFRKVKFAGEMPSTREDGIRFLLHIDKRLVSAAMRNINSHTSSVKIVPATDNLPSDLKNSRVIEFKLKEHWGFPLAHNQDPEDHDPIVYLLNAMANLEAGEYMKLQLVCSPIRHPFALILEHKIRNNEDVISLLKLRKPSILRWLHWAFAKVSFGTLDLISDVTAPSTSGSGYAYTAGQRNLYDRIQVTKGQKPARQLSEAEQAVQRSIHTKVKQHLFRASLRVCIATNDSATTKERVDAVRSALAAYSVPGYQEFSQKLHLPYVSKYRQFLFRNRLPAMTEHGDSILSASELASLFHFPVGIGKADNLQTSLSPTLAAPVSLKQNSIMDVIIGESDHHGVTTKIGLMSEERERHLYIIGATGTGKTTLLQYMIVQDMQAGKGLAMIDPHGDLAMNLLNYVPEDRLNDVIYFNPDDLDHPIGLNLLEMLPGLTGNDYLRDRDYVTSTVVSVFRKIFSDDDSGGHRVEYVLRYAVLTALTVPGATLFTVLKLIQNTNFRNKVVDKLEDEDLIDFWKSELGQAGNMQKVKMSIGVTSKIGRFNSSAAAKFVLGQEKSTINFEDIINSGKILICNFSKSLGEDISELFGITVLAKLQLASLRRAKMPPNERKPFYLYVDEFQNFATPSFVQMLSESRKYKLFMTMAEQSTSQQKDIQTVQVILANVGTLVCFRTANAADEQFFLPLFKPYLDEGKLANLPAYNFYAKLSAVKPQEPLSGQTLLLPDEGDSAIADKVIALSRANFAGKQLPKQPRKQKPTKKSDAKEEPDNKDDDNGPAAPTPSRGNKK
jgi:hypothetical protein